MQQVIAERLAAGTGAVIGARTVEGTSAACLLVGNEIAVGVVNIQTAGGQVRIRVSGDEKDYQRARVYEDGKPVESLLYRDGSVVYVDDAAASQAADRRGAAAR